MTDLQNPTDPKSDWQRDHLQRYLASGGEDGHLWRGVPTLLLTTIGHKSGKARRTPLIYGQDGPRYLVVASKGGNPEHPLWYRNLAANPHVRLQVGNEEFDATARTATPEEKPALWSLMAEIWPDYNQYQTKTDRDIPVVILERASLT
jgi:deazaflavin-dependent oxidoreductase (nitroreductase family)